MALNIQPMSSSASGVKLVLLGKSGIGKTSQLLTLDPEKTLFIDHEAGDLAVQTWKGQRLDVFAEAQRLGWSVWEMARGLACWLGGPSPLSLDPAETYSVEHYQAMVEALGDPAPLLARFDTFFIDSITVVSRACFLWCKTQPRAFSQKKVDAQGNPAPDLLGTYGLLKESMVGWLTQYQHVRGKNLILVGILDESTDDVGRKQWVPQIEGAATANALPGIVDEVVTMAELKDEQGSGYRAFVCHTLNPWGFPAKDRSTCLDILEPPDLGKLIAKINRADRRLDLTYQMPAATAAMPS